MQLVVAARNDKLLAYLGGCCFCLSFSLNMRSRVAARSVLASMYMLRVVGTRYGGSMRSSFSGTSMAMHESSALSVSSSGLCGE